MTLIKNRKAFKAFYPYKSPPNKEPCPAPEDYPKRYPCFCDIINEDGGIMGDYMRVDIVYPPRGCLDLRSFKAGLEARQ